MGDRLEVKATADALAALGRAHQAILDGEVEQLLAVLAVCQHHRIDDTVIVDGCERFVSPGGDGTPEIGEFVVGEISGQIGASVGTARGMVADALNLRFRHPRLFAAVVAGRLPAWHANRILRTTGLSSLTVEAADWVDRQIALVAGRRPLGTVLREVEGWVIRADQAAAAERAAAKARCRDVRLSTIVDGHVELWGQLDAADALALDRALDHAAHLLAATAGAAADSADAAANCSAEQGGLEQVAPSLAEPTASAVRLLDAQDRHAILRAQALGVIARSALGEATILDQPTLPGDAAAGRARKSPTGAGVRAASIVVHIDATRPGCPHRAADGTVDPPPTHGKACDGLPGPFRDEPREGCDGPPAAGAAIAVIDGWGPVTREQLQTVLTGARVIVRPVLDPRTIAPTDRHDPSGDMRLALAVRDPIEVFPYGTTLARNCQADHITPYCDDGPPGQTDLPNLALLGGFAHRLKTHGRWSYRQTAPGVFTWTSRYGFRFRVDVNGTLSIGRDTSGGTVMQDCCSHCGHSNSVDTATWTRLEDEPIRPRPTRPWPARPLPTRGRTGRGLRSATHDAGQDVPRSTGERTEEDDRALLEELWNLPADDPRLTSHDIYLDDRPATSAEIAQLAHDWAIPDRDETWNLLRLTLGEPAPF